MFPRPLETWSTQDVLVEEYQNAISLEVFLKNGAGPYSDTLAEVGLDAFLVSAFLSNDDVFGLIVIRNSEHASA